MNNEGMLILNHCALKRINQKVVFGTEGDVVKPSYC